MLNSVVAELALLGLDKSSPYVLFVDRGRIYPTRYSSLHISWQKSCILVGGGENNLAY